MSTPRAAREVPTDLVDAFRRAADRAAAYDDEDAFRQILADVLPFHERMVRAKVAEQLRDHAAGHRRTAKRAGVMRFELVRRAQVLEAEATRIERPAPAQTTAAHTARAEDERGR